MNATTPFGLSVFSVAPSLTVACLLGASLALGGCQQTPAKPAESPKKQAQSASASGDGAWQPKRLQLAPSRVMNAPALPPGHDNTLPPGHPPIGGAEPGAAAKPAPGHAAAGAAGKAVTADGPRGPVDEILQAGRYTYLRIGKVWSAVPVAHVKIGQDVAIVGAMKMQNFVSKATGRTFPEVWFGNLAVRRDVAESMKNGATGGERGGGAAAQPPHAQPVAKATGADAYTVAEVIAKRNELKGKRVRLRARVVKFNAEILNRNWLHLQDGTGDRGAKTDDLTVTTDAAAKVGDVVLVEGIVAIDRDFGAGYSYPVLVEKAKVTTAP